MTASASPRRWLFVMTILVGSFLLFLVQPMVARMVLPKLGGAPAVWNSAMLVYQALLLGGYAYAHWLGRFQIRRQAAIHVALLVAAALWLPIGIANIAPPAAGQEALWVPLLLIASIGPVFFVVAAQAPLMQRWFAADTRAGDPYILYAASNLGSFAGLISYPALVEPSLPLAAQSWGWTAGYALLVALVAISAATRWRAGAETVGAEVAEAGEAPPTLRRQIHWLLIAAVPSGLMLSTTTHLTTDIVAMPLLWVLPLGLYLLSFVIAFSTMDRLVQTITVVAPAGLLAVGGLSLLSSGGGSMTIALSSLAMLFLVATALHGYLYHLRPAPRYLTLFYLIMSAGGVLGGLFAALFAPLVFDWVYEHPLLVLASAMLLPLPALFPWDQWLGLKPRAARLAAALLVAIAAFSCWKMVDGWTGAIDDVMWWGIAIFVIGLLVIGWRWAFVPVLALLMLGLGGWDTVQESFTGMRVRSYFGVYTVTDDPQRQQRRLAHGTTLHGLQRTDAGKQLEPTTYYGHQSGVGLTLDKAEALAGPDAAVGIVGLGAGTLACYRKPGQQWTIFEIDPVMVDIARDPAKFTFLSECAGDTPIVLGDARLQLANQPPGRFDILVIDAFSSDAIPLHLMTKEAVGIYARAMKPDGVLLIHISNRFFDLEPVLTAEAKARGWSAAIRKDPGPIGDDFSDLTGSNWVVLTATPQRMEQLTGGIRPRKDAEDEGAWVPLKARANFERWTDDYASTLPVLMWKHLIGNRE
ncbi:spermidine synthase [Sphingopyxis sp. R3-92]|uniref:spermidine synthase n=1 Tax=Sphingopyxis sp. R3-92 TaxID=3158553 RepID=UPI003EE67D2B